MDHKREQGARRFWLRILALLIKRWHVFRRQYIFLFGFFLLPILTEILIITILPTPQQIQSSLTQNERIKDAKVTLIPSIYNPHTVVTYAGSGNTAGTNTNNYLQGTGATVDAISTDNVFSYVRDRYRESEDIFVNKYQIGFASYINGTPSNPSLIMNSYFSTVNYHTMPTSLTVGSTALFQFYANSTAKKIITTNQPVLTTGPIYTVQQRLFEIIYCFDTLPFSLFNFINSIAVALFASILMVPIIQERISHSKDLQLLTNLSRTTYWLSNAIFDLCLCLILCAFLTIIVKVNLSIFFVKSTNYCISQIGGAATSNVQSEAYTYYRSEPPGYFFLMIIMYSLASLPLIYVFSFAPKSELIGFIAFFVINVIGCFFDMILDFISVFSQAQAVTATGRTMLSVVMLNLTWVLQVIFPSVNFKSALFDIRLKSNSECISALNSLFFANYDPAGSWMSIDSPGLAIAFLIFCGQMIFWWVILILIENGTNIRLICRRCCKCDQDLQQEDEKNHDDSRDSTPETELRALDDEVTISRISFSWQDAVCFSNFFSLDYFSLLASR